MIFSFSSFLLAGKIARTLRNYKRSGFAIGQKTVGGSLVISHDPGKPEWLIMHIPGVVPVVYLSGYPWIKNNSVSLQTQNGDWIAHNGLNGGEDVRVVPFQNTN